MPEKVIDKDGDISVVKSDYKAQIQATMGYMQDHHPTYHPLRCWFVVWQPTKLWVTHAPFDLEYYNDLMQRVSFFYNNQLLVALTARYNRRDYFKDLVADLETPTNNKKARIS